jgi:hypothetical protein
LSVASGLFNVAFLSAFPGPFEVFGTLPSIQRLIEWPTDSLAQLQFSKPIVIFYLQLVFK